MADIEITCPECGNKRSVPDDLVGKKIKCRKCQSIFTVKGPPPKGKKPADKGASKAVTPVIPLKKDDDEDDKNPYRMTEENLAARCPFCAQLMDPPDAKICIHCGYDMTRRQRVERKFTYEITAVDYMLHHLPTFLCFVGIGMIVGFMVYCVMNFEEWMSGSCVADVLPATCWQTWCVIFCLFPIWLCAKFIFKRLVWQFHPPEKEKKIVSD